MKADNIIRSTVKNRSQGPKGPLKKQGTSKICKLWKKHGEKNGVDIASWLEAERILQTRLFSMRHEYLSITGTILPFVL